MKRSVGFSPRLIKETRGDRWVMIWLLLSVGFWFGLWMALR